MTVRDSIWAVLLTILEFTKYFIGYTVVLELRKSRHMVTVGAFYLLTCIIQVLVINIVDTTWVSIIILGMGVLIPLAFIEGPITERLLGYLLIVPGVSIIDILGSTLFNYIFTNSESGANGNILLDLVSNMTSLILLIVLYAFGLHKGRKSPIERSRMSIKQYLIMGGGILSCLLILAGRQSMLKGQNMSVLGGRVWYLATVFASCMYVVLSIYQIITDNRAKDYKKKNEYYEEFIQLQEDYIKHIVNNDKTLRSFRHDMHYHLTAIKEYSKNGQYDEIAKYLDSIENYSGLYSFKKYTSNTAVDAIICELIKEAEEKDIVINIKGTIPSNCNIEAYELCTVISNLLKNAVEASEALKDRPKEVHMMIYSYENKLYISLENNVEKQIIIKHNELVTSKKDKSQHGFGTFNIKRVVEKYGGTIEYTCENYVFKTEILM